MEKRRRDRARMQPVAVAGVLAGASAGYVAVSTVAGVRVPSEPAILVACASWLCVLLLLVQPRGPLRDRALDPASGRAVDPVSGLTYYDAGLDDDLIGRVSGEPWAVLVIEVDAGGATLAPGVGNLLLARAAERILAVSDSYGGLVRRLHRPQFAVIVAGLDSTLVQALASTLHDTAVRASVPDGDQPGEPVRSGRVEPSAAERTASVTVHSRLVVGVAVSEDGRGEVAQLIGAASAATTKAKRQHADAPVYFFDSLAEEARERQALGRALTAAIEGGEIDVVFQPQVDLVDGSLVGVEALARWTWAGRGPVAPTEFIAMAAELGLSREFDRLIATRAIVQLAAWDAAGVAVPRMSINITPETVADGRGLGLAELVRTHGIDPARLTFELVESRMIEGRIGAEAVRRCRETGAQVALDDFGTCESAHAQLASLAVTGVKIDRTLLCGREPDANALGAIISSGTALGLSVCAVGVETDEQRDLLVRLGCVAAQGFLFSPPLTAAEVVDWVRVAALVE